jgi:tetratricopeptide (TPR) repeat protein
MESLAALFYLSTIYFYLHARTAASNKRRIIFFTLSGILAILGILTKETAVTIPLMILACEFILWPNSVQTLFQSGKNFLRTNSSKLYILILLGTLIFFALFMKIIKVDLGIFFITATSDSHDGDILGPLNYFLTQMRVFLTFIRLLILPIQQNLDYDYPMSIGILQPPLTLAGMLLIGIILISVFQLRKKHPLIALGLAWILITFSINLAPRHNVIFEHKLYLISFGFILAAVLTLSNIIQSRVLLISIFSILIITLSITSFYRNQVWQNSLTLWEDVVEKSPNKARALTNLGRTYCALGKFNKAIPLFNKAIRIKPSDYLLYVSRASAYNGLNLLSQAREDLNKVIQMKPNSCSAHMELSQIYKKEKNYPQALQELDLAIALDPSYPEGYVLRAHLFFEQGQKEKAMENLQQAANIDPYNLEVLGGLAQIHIEQEKYELAIQNLTKTIQINPKNPTSYQLRASCYLKINQPNDAINDFSTALNLSSK